MARTLRTVRILATAALISAATAFPVVFNAHPSESPVITPAKTPCVHHPTPSVTLVVHTPEPVEPESSNVPMFTPEPIHNELSTAVPIPSRQPTYTPEPSNAPLLLPEESLYPSSEPAYPSQEPIFQSNEPIYPSEEPVYPSKEPAYSPEKPIYPSKGPLYPAEEPNLISGEAENPKEGPILPTAEPVLATPELGHSSGESIMTPGPVHPSASALPSPSASVVHDPKRKCYMRNVDFGSHTAEQCCEERFPCGSAQCKGSDACKNPDMCHCRKPVCRKVYMHFSYHKELTGDCTNQMIKL